jgi:putative peptidoglycan lipid II flippase
LEQKSQASSAPATTPPRESVAGAAGRVSLATGFSRIAGLLREAVAAALLGAGGTASSFVLAFRIPNLLRDFFAEGALSAAFVPAFARARAERGDAAAFLLARRVLGTLLLVTSVIAVLGIVFAPAVVAVIAPDAPASVVDLTVDLTRILFPFLPLAAAAALLMGVLNTYRRYFVPALAPAFFNVVAVLGGLGMLALGWDRPDRLVHAATGWAVLAVLGGVAQVAVQSPLARRVGWRGLPLPDLRFSDPGVRTVARRMAPVVLALAGTNVMLLIVTALASRDEAWPAILNYAFRLVHLPIGLIGVAVGTVVLAAGSRASASGDTAGVDELVGRGLRLNWFLALPAAVGLAVLAEPLMRLLYQRGNFRPEATRLAAEALVAYAPGIVFYAGVKAAAPLFLARGNTRAPVLCSLAGILVTIVAAFAGVGPLGFRGLALAVAAGATTNYLLLRALGRRAYGPASAVPGGFLLRVGVSAGVMGAAGFALERVLLGGDRAVASGALHAALTLGAVAALAALYFVVVSALGVEEAGWVRRRLGRRRAA